MKKIIIITIIGIAIVMILYAIRSNSSIEKIETPIVNEKGTFRPDPSNATLIIDDESITLSKGRNNGETTSGNTTTEETTLLDKFAYGDINTDGKEDTVLFLARYGGGSGTFIYLGAYISGPVTYKGSKVFFIGDRIVPQSISINKGVVNVTYLDRKMGEAFATEPTISVSKQFIFKNGEFQEK